MHVLTEEKEEVLKKKRKTNRLNINGKIITDLDMINLINQTVFQKDTFKHLCVYENNINYIDFCNQMKQDSYYDVNIFSKICHFQPENSTPVFF